MMPYSAIVAIVRQHEDQIVRALRAGYAVDEIAEKVYDALNTEPIIVAELEAGAMSPLRLANVAHVTVADIQVEQVQRKHEAASRVGMVRIAPSVPIEARPHCSLPGSRRQRFRALWETR